MCSFGRDSLTTFSTVLQLTERASQAHDVICHHKNEIITENDIIDA